MPAKDSSPTVNNQDLAKISPDSLWAVWSRTPEFLVAHSPELGVVGFDWIIASPGVQGLREITQEFPSSLIAALPLHRLREVMSTLPHPKKGEMPGWVRVGLGFRIDPRFALMKGEDGQIHLQKTRRFRNKGETLMGGYPDKFRVFLEKGEVILSEKIWMEITDDVRHNAQEGPVKWFYHQRDPKGSAILEELFNE